MTLRERFEIGLKAAGFRLEKQTPRYNVYVHPLKYAADRDGRIFLGKNGAVRVGRTAAESVPMGLGRKQVLLARTENPNPSTPTSMYETDR